VAVPDKIPISRLEDYHTRFVGICEDGRQFMSFVVASLPEVIPRDVGPHKRWYAVLHLFDVDGNHLSTDARFAGLTADGEPAVLEKAYAFQDEMLNNLGSIEWTDIAVRLFSVLVDGRIFGLVDTSFYDDGEYYETLTLLPNDFVFTEPWDGDFDT